MDKKEIVAILDEMGTLLELQGANPFKSRAFHAASRAVEGITGDIPALVGSGELLQVKGIGKSIAAIIGDLAISGKSSEYSDLRKGFPDGPPGQDPSAAAASTCAPRFSAAAPGFAVPRAVRT